MGRNYLLFESGRSLIYFNNAYRARPFLMLEIKDLLPANQGGMAVLRPLNLQSGQELS
jgi:hypothetical protein